MLIRHTSYVIIIVGISSLVIAFIALSAPALKDKALISTTATTSLSLPNSQQKLTEVEQSEKTQTTTHTPFSDMSLSARAAYVYDVKNKKTLYGLHEQDSLPLASITKVMTVIAALSYLRNPDTVVTISSEDLMTEGESGLKAGEKWRLSDLASFTLITSSNDGAAALGRAVESETHKNFSESTAELSKTIGLSQAYFLNPSGLDESTATSGAYGSARDVALLLSYGIQNFPDIFEQTAKPKAIFTSLSGISHKAENTNATVGTNIGIIASKTGTTDLAGGNLVIAFDAGPSRPIIVSVLHADPTERYNDVSILAKQAIASITQ